jgi:hypothetical protein
MVVQMLRTDGAIQGILKPMRPESFKMILLGA